jgi:3-keto-L-gulonate-6-phosphate decarboxylase
LVDVLAHDRDYKVRAAVAEALGRLASTTGRRYNQQLALDENWHVRERLIGSLAAGDGVVDKALCSILLTDDSWRHCPAHVRTSMERLLLTNGVPRTEPTDAFHRALFGLLREIRTGSVRLPEDVQARLMDEAHRSANWLVGREAASLHTVGTWPEDVRGSKEAFRRLRDDRTVQVALDLRDLQQAVKIAEAVAQAGARFVEVGDPLVKNCGVAAIERVKQAVPNVAVVAEMMSADWGRDQVVLAAEAGADVVLLIGPASTASVSAAVDASRRLGVPLVLDAPQGRFEPAWVQAMERTGVDGFAITTNIDLGVAGPQPLERARILRSWTRLPVAVSGGFGPADDDVYTDHGWDILIVGRSVTDAVDPATAAEQLINRVMTFRPKAENDHYTA